MLVSIVVVDGVLEPSGQDRGCFIPWASSPWFLLCSFFRAQHPHRAATPTRQARSPLSPAPNTHGGKPRKRKRPKEKGAAYGDGGYQSRRGCGCANSRGRTGDVAATNEELTPPTPGVEPLYPVQKKVRNLNKKVRSAHSLRLGRGLTYQ